MEEEVVVAGKTSLILMVEDSPLLATIIHKMAVNATPAVGETLYNQQSKSSTRSGK